MVAAPLRGRWAGNRGCLHEGRDIVRHHRGRRWIICETSFRGRWSPQWRPGRFTWLFFHDEAVGLAAGHRPCAQCRWAAFCRFRDAFPGGGPVDVLDRRLHDERWHGRRRRFHSVPWPSIPAGAFVLEGDVPALVLDDGLVPWTVAGYGRRRPRPPSGDAVLITPPSTCEAIRAGYPVQIDPTTLRS